MMNKKLVNVFKTLGMGIKHVKIYQSMLQHTSTTPLLLARETKLNRSSIYRYLSDLQAHGLVEEMLEENSSRYVASPIENLQLVVIKEESKLETLKRSLPILIDELKSTKDKVSRPSEVKYYRGEEGLKQMLWKMVNSGLDYMGLGFQNWNKSVGRRFAEKLRKLHLERGSISREILNEVDESFEYTEEKEQYQKTYEHRAIDKNILDIKYDTYIYGDTFAYYYHYQGELFGVEIHNKEIARTEKQIFEILWKIAK